MTSKGLSPRVSIIVLNYNGQSIIRACLDSIMKTNYTDLQVFVFDNGSTDSSRQIISEFKGVKVFTVDKNLGFTRGANAALARTLEATDAEYLVFFTNDVQVTDGSWISRLVEIAESEKGSGIIGCRLLYPDGRIQHAGVTFWPDRHRGKFGDGNGFGKVEEMDAVTGACILIRRKLLLDIGGFDEIYSPFYYEDIDLCLRARRAGFRVIYAGDVTLIHAEGTTIKMSDEKEYALARNAMIFYRRYASLPQAIKKIALTFIAMVIHRKDSTRPFSIGNFEFAPLMSILRFPYRFVLVSAGFVNGMLAYRKNLAPALVKEGN